MRRATSPVVVPVPVPTLELWLGLVWWTVGATAFATGPGTVVLATGLVVMAWLHPAVRRAHGVGVPLSRGGRADLLRRVGVTIGLVAALSMGLGHLTYGELVAPVACVLGGIALARSSRLLGDGSTAVAGAALAVVGVAGAVLALNTPGELYPRGLLGLGAATLLWLAGAYRTRVLAVPPGSRR